MVESELSQEEFENEVRRLARLLWPDDRHAGSRIEEGREHDGVFITEECVHLVEATTSRRKDKAEEDAKKLRKLGARMRIRYPEKGVKLWFVTLYEPTADQRAAAEENRNDRVIAISFDQFRGKLIDAPEYLTLRRQYTFGSVADSDGKPLANVAFVKPTLVEAGPSREITIADAVDRAIAGHVLVVLGDYGTGKSTVLREVFVELERRFRKEKTRRFPVHLNLRDHQGQSDPVEALERHARSIGSANASHLVRAWRSGFVILLIDGFDEIGRTGWVNQVALLRDLRHQSMELVRRLVRDTPKGCGLVLAGREHYFDDRKELAKALQLPSGSTYVAIKDFDDSQVRAFLANNGWTRPIPAWLPPRPLLLGYLATRGLLSEVEGIDPALSPAHGWDMLLDRISTREAEIEAGIDGATVRLIVERLAALARSQQSGMGPITRGDLTLAFNEVCGYPPDDKGLLLLQRLPGLGVLSPEDGSRRFIDVDLVDAARAGEVARFVASPFDSKWAHARTWQCPLGDLGVEVAALQLVRRGVTSKELGTAIARAAGGMAAGALATDLVRILVELGLPYEGADAYIANALVPSLFLGQETPSLAGIEFQECLFQQLELDTQVDGTRLPRFVKCYFGRIEGRASKADMPAQFDQECMFESFGESLTTANAILDSSLDVRVRVLLTVLRKLFLQRGSARKEGALLRGLDHRSRRLVPEILSLVASEGLATKSRGRDGTLWVPVRTSAVRVNRIISAPRNCGDSLMARLDEIAEVVD